VLFADVGPIKVPEGLTDVQVLFLPDILPIGFVSGASGGELANRSAAPNCNRVPGLMLHISAPM